MKERVYWVDYLKAFAMFLVVLGHSGIDDSSILKSWIYGFHMPLFVFMSGYFISSPRPIIKELKKDFKTLVVPYLFFSLFLIPFYYVVQRLIGVHISSSMFTYISTRLLMDDYYHCGPIWFLGALLIIKVSFNSVQAVLQNGGGYKELSIILIIILVVVLDLYSGIHLCSADSALLLFPYYVAGTFCSKILGVFSRNYILILGLIGMSGYTLLSFNNTGIDYDQLKLGTNVGFTYIEGMLGCFSLAFLFSLLSNKKNEWLRDMGMNTLTILGFHGIFIQVFRFAYKYAVSEVIPVWYLFIISIVSFVFCYLLSLVLSKWCPVAIGRMSK